MDRKLSDLKIGMGGGEKKNNLSRNRLVSSRREGCRIQAKMRLMSIHGEAYLEKKKKSSNDFY